MVGQNIIRQEFESQIKQNKFPRCTLLIGPQGSGRRTLSQWVSSRMTAQYVECVTKASDVRDVIKTAYQSHIKTVYVFSDIDNMSVTAANALLKFLEEPPNNAYIICTASDVYSVLNTVVSRCVVFEMNYYSYEELVQYGGKQTSDGEYRCCVCPGDVNRLQKLNTEQFYEFVNMVIDNVAEVSGANALKIGSKIAFKEESDKYPIDLFFRAVEAVCIDKLVNEQGATEDYADIIQITSKYLQELRIKGVNRSSLFDAWVLAVRQALIEIEG